MQLLPNLFLRFPKRVVFLMLLNFKLFLKSLEFIVFFKNTNFSLYNEVKFIAKVTIVKGVAACWHIFIA